MLCQQSSGAMRESEIFSHRLSLGPVRANSLRGFVGSSKDLGRQAGTSRQQPGSRAKEHRTLGRARHCRARAGFRPVRTRSRVPPSILFARRESRAVVRACRPRRARARRSRDRSIFRLSSGEPRLRTTRRPLAARNASQNSTSVAPWWARTLARPSPRPSATTVRRATRPANPRRARRTQTTATRATRPVSSRAPVR